MSSFCANTLNAPAELSLFSRIFKNGDNGKSSLLKSSEKLLASLESVQVNLLFADPQYNLIYANKMAINTLSSIKDDIRKEFKVSVEDMVGGVHPPVSSQSGCNRKDFAGSQVFTTYGFVLLEIINPKKSKNLFEVIVCSNSLKSLFLILGLQSYNLEFYKGFLVKGKMVMLNSILMTHA